ncbi:hypothetical protein BC831DRAFT_6905 [Entophlyctis helioformis]|nr:hypothetical protein BC831DRAFT_6905 [Entophlyctis helioformis]
MPHRRVAVTVADAIRAPEARPLVLLSDYLILACLRLAPFVPAIFLLVTYGVSLVDSLVTFDLSASPRLGDSMSGNRLHPIVFSYLFGLSGIYLNAVLSAFCNAAVGKQSWHMWAIMTICVMINFGVFVLVAVFVSFSSPFLYILLILFVSSCIAMPSTYRRFEDGALWLRLAKSFGAPLLGGIIGLCIDLINIGCIMLGSGMGGQSAIVQVLANGLIYPIIRWPVYHMAAYMHRLLTLNEEDHDALDYEHVRKRMVMHVIAEGMYFEASGTIAILKTADYGTFLASMALRKCLLLALRVFKLKRALDAARKQKSQVAPDVGGSLRGLASYGTEQSGMNYNYNTAGVSNPASDDRSSDPYMPHRVSRSQTFGRKASVRVEEIIKTVGRLSSYIGIQASRAVDIDTYPLHYDEVSPMQDRSLATQAQAASNSTPISSTESPTAGVNYSYVATTTQQQQHNNDSIVVVQTVQLQVVDRSCCIQRSHIPTPATVHTGF